MLIILLILITGALSAQPTDFASTRLIGAGVERVVNSDYFDGKSLWGYMNGGADLYLEYGFEGLLVEEIVYKGVTLKCEFFRMKDALSAFGIFSVQRHKCIFNNAIDDFHCINNYQLQVVRGNYYISLINQTGEPSAVTLSQEAAGEIIKHIEKASVVIPNHEIFKGQDQRLIFLKGEISLSNVYPQALAYLDDVNGYTAWLLPETKTTPSICLLQFETEKELAAYQSGAFPGISFGNKAAIKLKKGKSRVARKIDLYTILQAEGKVGKQIKKMFEI
ncbi:MAG: hypothetical protein HC905_09665 [Bacteroidales bacterium]|nr:hypothetical protein [Bacteroidales bacterium]